MIEPLAADLLAGALAHGLADVVARAVGVERVQPDENGVLILRLELRLTVCLLYTSLLPAYGAKGAVVGQLGFARRTNHCFSPCFRLFFTI